MSETSTFKDILKKNSNTILAVLRMPIVGMTASIPLVIWKAPHNMMIVLGVILVLMIQYILLARWIANRMDELTREQSLETSGRRPSISETLIESWNSS